MQRYITFMAFAAIFALIAADVGAERIVTAHYADPVERYGHFALGRPHEYARLIATTDTGCKLSFQLPENEVFEDLAPRLVRLAADAPDEILAIVSQRDIGSRLMVVRLTGGQLEVSAQSLAIGTPMRWLNPVAVVDLDGDGRTEIAAVITPHINGTLKVYHAQGRKLVEISALGGFSNHRYGTEELALSAHMVLSGKRRLLVPDAGRSQLRVIGLENGRLVEISLCALPAPVIGAMRVMSPTTVSIGLVTGRQVISPLDCLK